MEDRGHKLDRMLSDVYHRDSDAAFTNKVMQQLAGRTVPAASRNYWKLAAAMAASLTAVLAAVAVIVSTAIPGSDKTVRLASEAKPSEAGVKPVDGVVNLHVPLFELEQRLAKSDYLSKDFFLLLGRLTNPRGRGAQSTVEFKIDRVLKGEGLGGKIITRDELPSFHCQGAVVASSTFPLQQPLLCWLTRDDGKWTMHELQKPTPRFMKVYEAVTSPDATKKLRPLITPHGLDFETTEIIKLFGKPAQIDPLLKDIVQKTPPLLESLRGAPGPSYDVRWQQRMKLVSLRVSPCLDILSRHNNWLDGSVVDLILPCYPPLQDAGGESLRAGLNYHLAAIVRVAVYQPDKSSLSPQQVTSIRKLMLAEVKGLGDGWTVNRSTACGALSYIADSKAVALLLKEQAKRPVHAGHKTLADALWHIYSNSKTTAEDRQLIQQGWMLTLQSFEKGDVVGKHKLAESYAASFARAIAGSLVRGDLSHAERQIVRQTYYKTEVKWLKSALAWQVEQPALPKPDAGDEAVAYQFGEAYVARYTNASPPSAEVTRLVTQWKGPHMLKLIRTAHAAEIVQSLEQSSIVDLHISYTPLTRELLAAIGRMVTLRTVSFHGCSPVEADALSQLITLKKLKSLSISSTNIVANGADGVAPLAGITSLEQLYLDNAGPISDRQLAALGQLQNLQVIRVTSQQLTNAGLKPLTTLPQLQTVVLPSILLEPQLINAFERRNVAVFPRPAAGPTCIWDTASGVLKLTGANTGGLSFTAGGKILAADDQSGELNFYRVASGSRDGKVTLPATAEWAVARNNHLLALRSGKTIRLTNALPHASDAGVSLPATDAHGLFRLFDNGSAVATSHARLIQITGIAADGKIAAKKIRNLKPAGEGYFSPGQPHISRDGKWLAAAGNGHAGFRVWRTADGKEMHRYDNAAVLFGFTSNALLFSGSDKKQLRAMDLATGAARPVLTFKKGSQPLFYSLAEGHFAYASSSQPVVVDLYNTNSWKLIRQFRLAAGDDYFITSLDLSPGGKLLAVSGNLNHQAD